MSKIVLSLDSHSLSQFQRCPRSFQLGNIRCLSPRKEAKALSKGTLLHEVLAEYYNGLKEGVPKAELAPKIFTSIQSRKDTGLEYDELQAISSRFLEYAAHYEKDWEPIRVEGFQHTGFSKVLYEDARVKFIYEGRIDLLARVAGKFNYWVDFKSQSARYSFNRFPNVNQFIGYSWASGFPGIIGYVTWSKTVSDRTFRRQDITYSPQFIEKWRQSTIGWFKKILKSISKGEYDYDFSACDTKYGACSFNKICSASNQRAEDWIIKNDFKKTERWKAW